MSDQDCCNQNCRQGRDCPQRRLSDHAPDLLLALKEIAELPFGLLAARIARAAIAKATGTTP